MSTLGEAIAATIQTNLGLFGETTQIYKYTGHGTENQYKQSTKTYASPITIRTFVEPKPSAEQLSEFGCNVVDAGMLTFGKKHILAAFPSATVYTAIEVEDHVVVRGHRHKIFSVHYTGNLEGGPEVVVALYEIKESNVG